MTANTLPEHPINTSAPRSSYAVFVAGAAALGGFLFGFDTAVINGTVVALRVHFVADAVQVGLAVSLALLGSALGAFFAGQLADRIGRVRVMLIASLAFFVSALGSGMPVGLSDFIGWRILGGMAVGAASVIAPAYIAEISPAEVRGRLASLQQLAIVMGIFVALLSNYLIARAAGSAERELWFGLDAWRWMFWSEIPPAILYGLAALRIPKSPRFLVSQNREQEAAAILARLGARETVAEIRATVLREHKPRLTDLVSPGSGLLPIVWIGMALSALQQFVGINVIFYYSSVLWRAVGFSEEHALWVTMITGATNVLTTFIAIAYVDRFGRKPLLLFGSVGMFVTLASLALIFGNAVLLPDGRPDLSGTPGIVALVVANLYVFCFGFSWGPVVWVLLGEIFNNRIRGAALSLAAAVQWAANFLVSTSFPPLLDFVGLGPAYGMYAFWALVSFFFVLRCVRETKGMTLEEVR